MVEPAEIVARVFSDQLSTMLGGVSARRKYLTLADLVLSSRNTLGRWRAKSHSVSRIPCRFPHIRESEDWPVPKW